MMSRKDYELLAEAIAGATDLVRGTDAAHGADVMRSYIADALKATNPRFDRDRFITACLKPRKRI